MEHGVTLDVPSFSSLLFTALLLWISAQYKWRGRRIIQPLEISQVEVEFPRAPDPQNGYHMALIGGTTYGFVPLRTLSCCLIVYFPFLLLYGFMLPRVSAPIDGG